MDPSLPVYKKQPIYYEAYALVQHALFAGHIDPRTGVISPEGFKGFREYLKKHYTDDENIITSILTLDYLNRALGNLFLAWFMRERDELRLAAIQGNADYVNEFYKLFGCKRKFTQNELQEFYKAGKLEQELSKLDIMVAGWAAVRFGYLPSLIQTVQNAGQYGYYGEIPEEFK